MGRSEELSAKLLVAMEGNVRWNSFVSDRHKLVYIATPKVACTTLKWWFAGLEGLTRKILEDNSSNESSPELVIHDVFPRLAPWVNGLSPEELIPRLQSNTYYRFAVVRNPYTRIFSAWQSKILLREPLQIEPYLDKGFSNLEIKTKEDVSSAFEAFLEHLFSHEAPEFWDVHWTPQWTLLRPDVVSYSCVAQVESPETLRIELGRHLSPGIPDPFAIRRKNESLIRYDPCFISSRSAYLIKALYGQDFAQFHYDAQPPNAAAVCSQNELQVAFQAASLIRDRHQRLSEIRGRLSNQISSLNQSLAKRDTEIIGFRQAQVDRDQQIGSLREALGERDGEISGLGRTLAERGSQIASLSQTLVERDGQIANLSHTLAERDGEISGLGRTLAERGSQIASLGQTLAERDGQIANLSHTLAERDGGIAELGRIVTARDGQITSLSESLAERDRQVAAASQVVAEHEGKVAEIEGRLRAQEEMASAYMADANKLYVQYNAVLRSRSWGVTRPLRVIARVIRHRGLPPADRAVLIQRARAIGHSLPLPLWLKAWFHRLLLRIVGSSRHSSSVLPASVGVAPRPSAKLYRYTEPSKRPMRPECCALEPGLVSVILPVYNQASMLQDSIDSVLNQTYQNFELILLNDGSTDNVERIIEKYLNHPKIRLYTQPNQKLPKALSNAFELARGEFWTWTSADNLMEPRQLECHVERLRASPTLGMVYADYYAIDDQGQLLKDTSWRSHNRLNMASGEIRPPRNTELLNVEQDNFIGPCFMYRGWIGRVLGEYDPIQGVEDYDYWMRINALFSIEHLGTDDLLYRYRVHSNTLNARAGAEQILDKVENLMRYERRRADYYRARLRYFADNAAAEWLQTVGVPTDDVSQLSSFDPSLLSAQACAIVVSAATSVEREASFRQFSPAPVVILFDRAQVTPFEVAPLLRRPGVLAVANDERTVQRVRLVAPTPIIDAASQEVLGALNAFAKNRLFYESTRDAECRIRSGPVSFARGAFRKHVLLQSDSFTQGGMENVMIGLGCTLAGEGFEPRILVLGNGGDAVEKARERGLKVDVFDGRMDLNLYRDYVVRHRIDLINAHYSVYGSEVAREMGVPFVQSIHNSYVWLDPVTIEHYRTSDRNTSRYTCVSLTAAKYADCVLGLDVCKMTVVPNGIDTSVFSGFDPPKERERLRQKWGVDENDTVFLNVASVHATKAQLPLLKAFSALVEKRPKCRLVLLGAVMDEAYGRKVREFVKRSGLEKLVIFAGYDREVGPYYHAADVFVLPSFWEGWSLSFGEALYVGLPIVSTNVGAAREFAHLENVMLIEPPFGDVTNLNYLNLSTFLHGDDEQFVARLSRSMSESLELRRAWPADRLRAQLDERSAYRSYIALFNSV